MKELELVEEELEILQGLVDEDYFFVSRKERLALLQAQKEKILRKNEET